MLELFAVWFVAGLAGGAIGLVMAKLAIWLGWF